MEMNSNMYTIGQMAELCNIPKKQLRYYDQSRILSPNYRDPVTSYRYYGENQIEEILLLQELKHLGVPLKKIGQMLSNRELGRLQQTLETRMYELRKELEVKQQKYNSALDTLLRVINGMSIMSNANHRNIKIIDFSKRPVLFTRYESRWNANNLFILRRAELFKIAERMTLRIGGTNLAIFHSAYMSQFSERPEDQSGDLEVCMNVIDQGATGPHIRTLGPFRTVSCIHIGHYRNMKNSYLAMEEWSARNGIALSEKAVEEYLIGATMTNNSDNYVTRLYVPMRDQCV